jgi:ACS family sodium-dependent inorganic phosphate cotransporter
MGMSNMGATIPGFAVPAFVGALTHGTPGLMPWHITFYTTAAILLFELVVYTLLASGVEQEWNRPQKSTDGDHHEKEALSA